MSCGRSPRSGWRLGQACPVQICFMDRNHRFPQAVGLCAAVAAALPAWANPPPPVLHEMEPVVVTGVAPEAPLIVTTDPKIPRQPIPASDGTDYLKTIPGFSAIRNGGSNGDPVLRGMFGSRLNILADGASMPGACPARMDAPPSYISPETSEK